MIRAWPSVRKRSAKLTRFSEKGDEQTSHNGRKEGHNYEHSENPLREHTHIITDIKCNEIHESPRVHQCAELKRLGPFHPGETRRQSTSTEFSRGSNRNDYQADEPILSTIEETNECADR